MAHFTFFKQCIITEILLGNISVINVLTSRYIVCLQEYDINIVPDSREVCGVTVF